MQVGRKNPKSERFSSALALSELSDLRLTGMVPVTHLVQVGRKNPKPERFSSALALSELSDIRLTVMVPVPHLVQVGRKNYEPEIETIFLRTCTQ